MLLQNTVPWDFDLHKEAIFVCVFAESRFIYSRTNTQKSNTVKCPSFGRVYFPPIAQKRQKKSANLRRQQLDMFLCNTKREKCAREKKKYRIAYREKVLTEFLHIPFKHLLINYKRNLCQKKLGNFFQVTRRHMLN